MINFSGLSGTGTSLNRLGIELGPSWSFDLTGAGNQFVSVGLLLGIAFASGKNENRVPVVETDGLEFNGFNSILLINYEFHHLSTGLVYSGGLYNVFGADAEIPTIGIGFNAGGRL